MTDERSAGIDAVLEAVVELCAEVEEQTAAIVRWNLEDGSGEAPKVGTSLAAVRAAVERVYVQAQAAVHRDRGCERRTKRGTCIDKGFQVPCVTCAGLTEAEATLTGLPSHDSGGEG